MKKFLLIVFILIDLIVVAVAVLFLVTHLQSNASVAMFSKQVLPMNVPNVLKPAVSPTSTPTMTTPAASAPPAPAVPSTRKILFSYRNGKAKKVMVRADFTGWRAEPMQKDANNIWRYTADLEPGEYAYCFSVDDKSIRDPANKRTKQVGKTFVSAIVVQAPSPPPPH